MRTHVLLSAALVMGVILLLLIRFPYALQSSWQQASFWYLLIIIVVGLIGGARTRTLGGLKKNTKHGLIWIALFVVLILGYAQKDALKAALLPQVAREGDGRSLVFQRSQDGHFYVEAQVNGKPVLFMVDTGATDIVLSPADARRVGIDPRALSYTKIYSTANGTGKGADVTLNRMAIGTMENDSLTASVNGAEMDTSLLGMAYLKRFARVEVTNDRMVLWP